MWKIRQDDKRMVDVKAAPNVRIFPYHPHKRTKRVTKTVDINGTYAGRKQK